MNKNYKAIFFLLGICAAFSALLLFSNNGGQLYDLAGHRDSGKVVMLEQPSEEPLQITRETRLRALILYSPGDETSVKYKENLEIVLEHLRMDGEALALSRSDQADYSQYDLVILASPHWETEMPESSARLMRYVEEGGKLFFGSVPNEIESHFQGSYRRFGVVEYGEYLEGNIIRFEQELIPGIQEMEFQGDGFEDASLTVSLEDAAEIYAWISTEEGNQTPLIWTYDSGRGRIAFFNGTAMSGDFWRGIAAGCINSLFDTAMYPVVNAMCLFIDDFPSPQYESDSDIVREAYNRSVKEFYRDIWWPDMQQIAKVYRDVYTGLFVASYDNIVDPEKFAYITMDVEQYFGNSLLKNGYEMGAHGYNHQSLTLAGGTPEEMGYKPWADQGDMEASLVTLREITAQLFPAVHLRCYVPPSNYLSETGRAAAVAALPELEVISGIYTNEGEEGSVYVQDFEIAQDGIAEFPRITAGMVLGDYDRLGLVSTMGLYGVVSHFIHPDDVFDLERGKMLSWEELYRSYCELINDIHARYPFLRSLSATEAGDALRISDAAQPHLEIGENEIRGSIENYLGETYFYLKTDAVPKTVDESCELQGISKGSGEGYYLVKVKSPNFVIRLVKE